MSIKDKIGVVILAAGKGSRMNSKLPKVMHLLNKRPLVDYVVSSVEKLGIEPVVVIANDSNFIRDFLKDRVRYIIQDKQLGTGHAVAAAELLLKNKTEHIIVLYGDMPFVKTKSIEQLFNQHLKNNDVLTLMTAKVADFNGWRNQFSSFGRIIRDYDNNIIKIIEKKDASEEELNIKELNSAFFCFKADWLWENLKNIKDNNAQGEYYLTDLVKAAFDSNARISSVNIDPKEAVGINTKDNLDIAKSLIV